MDLGVSLPTYNSPLTSPQAIVRIAQEAERLGYAAVWTYERILYALGDIDQGFGPPAPLPDVYKVAYDPIETLAYVAAKTERIKLGTSVVDALFHVPVVLARRFATLDRLSGGRVIAGLGQGWMEQEFATANVPPKRRGAGMDEFVAAMRAAWGPDPVSYQGRFYRIAPSEINPKPVQPGGPPILMALSRRPAWREPRASPMASIPLPCPMRCWRAQCRVSDPLRRRQAVTPQHCRSWCGSIRRSPRTRSRRISAPSWADRRSKSPRTWRGSSHSTSIRSSLQPAVAPQSTTRYVSLSACRKRLGRGLDNAPLTNRIDRAVENNVAPAVQVVALGSATDAASLPVEPDTVAD